MSNTIQELDYLVTADDIAHLNHFHLQQSPAIQRRKTYVGLILTVSGVFGFLVTLMTGGMPLLFMTFLIVMGIWTTLSKDDKPSTRHVQHIRKLYGEGDNRALFGHHHVRLFPDRIEVSTEYSRGEVKWEGVERVVENKDYIFIYVSALNAYVINKKYFTGEAHAQEFFAQAKIHHEQAMRHMLGSGYIHSQERLLPPPVQTQEHPKVSPKAHRPPLLSPSAAGSSGGTDGSL